MSTNGLVTNEHFDRQAWPSQAARNFRATAAAGGARFHAARGVGPEIIADIQAKVRARLLRALARRGLIERKDAEAMGAWDHGGGFSLDATVRIEAHDRHGLERLLRNSRPAGLRAGTAA